VATRDQLGSSIQDDQASPRERLPEIRGPRLEHVFPDTGFATRGEVEPQMGGNMAAAQDPRPEGKDDS